MAIARSVYKAASETEKMEAYYNLQDAETAYYGTDEGRASLIQHINDNSDSPNRKHWLEILDRADSRREFVETQIASLSKHTTQEAVLPFNPNMRVEASKGRKYVVVANGAYSDGIEYAFDWDQNSGRILYEEKNNPDSMRVLGTATDIGAAKNLCQSWFGKQADRAIPSA